MCPCVCLSPTRSFPLSLGLTMRRCGTYCVWAVTARPAMRAHGTCFVSVGMFGCLHCGEDLAEDVLEYCVGGRHTARATDRAAGGQGCRLLMPGTDCIGVSNVQWDSGKHHRASAYRNYEKRRSETKRCFSGTYVPLSDTIDRAVKERRPSKPQRAADVHLVHGVGTLKEVTPNIQKR